MPLQVVILVIFVFIYSACAGRIERMALSGPIVFIAFGFIFGPLCLGLLNFNIGNKGLESLAELTLALILFTDAAGADLKVLRGSFRIPSRLLLIGLPLTIALGFGFGLFLLKGLGLFELAILATLLAPTDAALGKPVITNPLVPTNIRESLNVESGLNDGICVPILFLFLALAVDRTQDGGTLSLAIKFFAEEIGIGLAVGISMTLLGVTFLKICDKRGWISDHWRKIPTVALAISCYALAQWLGGSGFIAAFVGGILFGALIKTQKHPMLQAAEGIGDTLALITWVVFGAIVLGHHPQYLTWPILLYSILSLTVIRMVPVFLALTGLGIKTESKLFIGWFGPRGLATIVFAVIVLYNNLPGSKLIAVIASYTIALSLILHGITANPWAKALGSKFKKET